MPSTSNEYVDVEVDTVEHDTGDAVLVVWQGEKKWIPHSVLEVVPSVELKTKTLQVREWFAHKEGLI